MTSFLQISYHSTKVPDRLKSIVLFPVTAATTLFCTSDKIKNEIYLDKDDDDCKSKLEESPSNESIGRQANEFQDDKEEQGEINITL